MAAYSISYDLREPGRNYERLYEAIRSYEAWAHVHDSYWIIIARNSASQVRDHLKQHMDRNDTLFVARLNGEAAWIGLSQETSNWLKQNLSQ